MITQTIKRWWHKLFARWSRNTSQNLSFTPVDRRANAALTPEPPSYTSLNGLTPQSGVAPLIAGGAQGDVTCSTIDGQSNRVPQEQLSSAESGSVTASGSRVERALETATNGATLKPTPQQQLDFLNYLVKRGLVNEGFTEDSVPAQYRHTH